MTISLFRSIAGQFSDLRSVNSVVVMNAISSLIEDQVIEHRMPIDFFAGFQRFSNFPDQLRRYSRLGAVCRRVYVIGVPDIRPPTIAGISFIPIEPSSPLAHEWFVLVNTPQFWTALLTQEVEGRDAETGGRRFDGLWSYDQRVVERASLLLSQLMGDFFMPTASLDYATQSMHIAAMSGKLLGKLEHVRQISRRRWAQLWTLHTFADALTRTSLPQLLVHNLPANLLHETTQMLRKTFGASAVAVVLNDDGAEYGVAIVDGEGVVHRRSIQVGEGYTGSAIKQAETVVVNEEVRGRDPLLPTAHSLLAVPIVGQRRVYGAITIAGGKGQAWSDEDRQSVQVIACLMAVTIEQRIQQHVESGQQTARVKLLERALVGLRKPIGDLLSMHQQLQMEGELSLAQREIAHKMNGSLGHLAQILNIPKEPLQQRAIGE